MAIRFPAGTTLGGRAVGGQFGSLAQARGAISVSTRYTTRFPEIITGMELRCHVASADAAERILEDAKQRVPIGTEEYVGPEGERHPGALHESLYTVHLPLSDDWAVASDLWYAPYVEFGTSRMAAQPYLIPAMEAERGPYIAETMAVLRTL